MVSHEDEYLYDLLRMLETRVLKRLTGELFMKIGTVLNALLISFFLVGIASAQIRYNDVIQKSFHNSYNKDEGVMDQLIFHRARSIEFDIRNTKIGQSTRSDDWFVYHIPVVDTKTNCNRLSNCFQELKTFDQTHPNHEVITVWFDINSEWGGSHTPEAFDQLAKQYLSEDDFVKPADLLAACPGAVNLRQAVTNGCDWPSLESIKGKWIFVVVGGGNAYNQRSNRLGFSPSGASQNSDVDSGSAIFYNLNGVNNNLSRHIADSNLISRRFLINNENDFNASVTGKVHHIATDKVNYIKDSWAVTHNENGWPFKCINENCDHQASDESVITIKVNSEDIWGRQDHFHFLYQDRGTQSGRWTASVAEASSHVDMFAKGCLMARASLSANSQYFSVCRLADNRKLRTQFRKNSGDNSSAQDNDINGAEGLDQPNLTYVKMDIYSNGRCAVGQGSQDGVRWTQIGDAQCFSQALRYRGIAGSSHGNATVLHKFSQLKRWNEIQTQRNFSYRNLGTVRIGQSYDGSMNRRVNPLPLTLPTSGKFLYDVGPANSPLFNGYLPLTAGASSQLNPYGWTSSAGIQSRNRGSSAGNNLNRDLLFNSNPSTFEQSVDNGNWYALITFGDVFYHDNMAVDVEGERKLDGITTQAGEYRNEFVSARVVDGKFTMTFSDESGVDPNWTITRIILQDRPFDGQSTLPDN